MTQRMLLDCLAAFILTGALSCKQCDSRSEAESPHPARSGKVASKPAVDAASQAQVAKPVPSPDISTRGESTKDLAQKIVEKTAHFQKLLKENPRFGLMLDDSDKAVSGPEQFDFRAYGENAEGETFTLGRYRVDFKQKKVLFYDPVKADYQEMAGSAALFVGTDRK